MVHLTPREVVVAIPLCGGDKILFRLVDRISGPGARNAFTDLIRFGVGTAELTLHVSARLNLLRRHLYGADLRQRLN